ncbi:Alpha/beta hydrolase fold protein [Perkinsela sp. CCAP 1560/4]|nr:Alpha/beta hydrolase fold protein [Perkinsela sp. CCAP 1560/4]|eukprot:KNH09666.1 Alpha/beta hydrolase fold protein [Perkinsela sp. CCAP 1560/4]
MTPRARPRKNTSKSRQTRAVEQPDNNLALKLLHSVSNLTDGMKERLRTSLRKHQTWRQLTKTIDEVQNTQYERRGQQKRRSPSSVRNRPRGFNPELHFAVSSGSIDSVRSILEKSSDSVKTINQGDYENRTPLHVAVGYANLEMVKYLVDNGSEVNATDARNRTPLFESSNEEISNFLRTHGAVDSYKYFAKQSEDDSHVGKMESTDVIQSSFIRKVLLALVFPVTLLLLMNGSTFAAKFLVLTCFYYVFVISYFVSEVSIKPPWYRPNSSKLSLQAVPEYWQGIVHDPKYDLGIDYEDVTFETVDKYNLSGWFVPSMSEDNQTGIVLVHGGGRDRRAWLRHVRIFHDAGFAVLLFDFREHGMSQGSGKGFTYGVQERHDVVAAAKYLKQKCSLSTVCAVGTSVGGSACIMAAAISPEVIDIVIAENPITTVGYLQHIHLENILGPYMHKSAFSMKFFNVFRWFCRWWINFRISNIPSKSCQALHVVNTISPRPILLMHGTADAVVPFHHSEVLFHRANEPKELWLAPDGFHCGLYDMFPQEFKERVLSFIQKYQKHQPSK